MDRWGIILIVALLVGACSFANRPRTYRYKVVVEVQTPEGPRSGYAVREVQWIPQQQWLSGNEFQTKQRGEAVAVDLPGKQTLFVLPDIDAHETIRAAIGQGSESDPKRLLDQAHESRKIYSYPSLENLRKHNLDLPRLVRFRDIGDPRSAEFVDPLDLQQTFGPGVSLSQITLQIVDEPLTNEIPARLPWRRDFPKGKLSGDRFEIMAKPEAAAHLSAFSFSSEPVS